VSRVRSHPEFPPAFRRLLRSDAIGPESVHFSCDERSGAGAGGIECWPLVADCAANSNGLCDLRSPKMLNLSYSRIKKEPGEDLRWVSLTSCWYNSSRTSRGISSKTYSSSLVHATPTENKGETRDKTRRLETERERITVFGFRR
jgi:hypothetical protein